MEKGAGKSNHWFGVLCALLAAVAWGVMSPAAKMISAEGVSLLSAMAVRAFVVAAVMGPWLWYKRGAELFSLPRPLLRYYFIAGLLSVVFCGGGFLMSLEYLSVAEALILHYTFPLVTLLGSLWITHEKPTKLQVLAGVLIIFGVYTGMVGGEKSFAGLSVPGLLWGLLAITGISGQSLVVRRAAIGGQSDQMALLFFSHLFGGIVLLLGKSVIMGWSDLIVNLSPEVCALMLFQAVSGSLLAYGFFFTALKYISAPAVSLLCTLEIVVAVGLTALLLGHIPSIRETVGCAVIIAAIICASVKPKELGE